MKTKFKYFKCLCWYSNNKIKKMYEERELSDKMYSNLLSAQKRAKWITNIMFCILVLFQVLCGLQVNICGFGTTFFCNLFFVFIIGFIAFLVSSLLETYFGTKGMK